MNAHSFSFRIFGCSCVVALPPALDGVAPANDEGASAWRDPWNGGDERTPAADTGGTVVSLRRPSPPRPLPQ